MKNTINLRIILEKPPVGVDFALQKGSGSKYEVIQIQKSNIEDLCFNFDIDVKVNDDSSFNFYSPIVQGPPNERFIYIDIGTYAHQMDSVWGRRLKIPLKNITLEMIHQLLGNSDLMIETRVAGTGKDGSPNCGTVKPFGGWYIGNNLMQ